MGRSLPNPQCEANRIGSFFALASGRVMMARGGSQRSAGMGYIESTLLPDETIVYKAKLHWIIFWKAIALIILSVIFLFILPLGGVIALAIGVLGLISPLIAHTTSEFGVTDKRVIIKVGLIRRRTLELLLRHVEAILVDQSVMGRLFNYGSVTLTGTGGVRETFDNIANPLEFRRRVQGEAAKDSPNRDPLTQAPVG
ncbi:MAG TPA: PH domain-containing protein [Terriglobales bacterium]|nr:PH domain-containing protein [Terriglobales bacterium]